jgi:hypothetical protein
MDDERKRRKAEIVRLIKEAAEPQPVRPRRAARGKPQVKISGTFNQSVVAAGDIHVHHHHAGRPRVPPPGSDREAWRKELCGAILARAAELKLVPEQVYDLSERRLRKRISALAELSAQDLGRLYDLIFKMKRPALD